MLGNAALKEKRVELCTPFQEGRLSLQHGRGNSYGLSPSFDLVFVNGWEIGH